MSHKRAVLLSLVCGALAAAACSVAGAADAASTAAKDKDDAIRVPEIIINGHKEKLSQLQAEIYKAEDDFWNAFNEVSTKPEYRTHCGFEVGIDTHIPTRVCKPEFVHAATEADVQSLLGNLYVSHAAKAPGGLAAQTFSGPQARPSSMVINEKMPAYRKYVRDLVEKNPKLREALGKDYALNQHYEAVIKEKHKGKWFVWD